MQENSDFRKIVVVGTESGRSCQSVHDATVNAFQSGSDGVPKGNRTYVDAQTPRKSGDRCVTE